MISSALNSISKCCTASNSRDSRTRMRHLVMRGPDCCHSGTRFLCDRSETIFHRLGSSRRYAAVGPPIVIDEPSLGPAVHRGAVGGCRRAELYFYYLITLSQGKAEWVLNLFPISYPSHSSGDSKSTRISHLTPQPATHNLELVCALRTLFMTLAPHINGYSVCIMTASVPLDGIWFLA